MPVDAYTIRHSDASFCRSKTGAASVRWNLRSPPYVDAVLSMPDGVPWYLEGETRSE